MSSAIILGEKTLSIEDVFAVAGLKAPLSLDLNLLTKVRCCDRLAAMLTVSLTHCLLR